MNDIYMPLGILPLTENVLTQDPALGATLLALNNRHAVELSLLDQVGLQTLVHTAFRAAYVGAGNAMLIAFDQSGNYSSPNFLWFRERFDRFIYVDRVVTAPHARGMGLARALYNDIFEHALAAGHTRIVCEVNSDPPNHGSDAFHAALGFHEAGSAVLDNGKAVRYLELSLVGS